MNSQKQSSILFKIALLSISSMLTLAASIAPALPLMQKTFSGYSQTAVQTISTIPNLGIIIGIFVGGFLSLKIGQKNTVLYGLTIAFITGIVPVFSNSYTLIIVSRLIFGIGIGFFNSLAISMISKYYSGKQLSAMMGYQGAVSSLGGTLAAFIISYLIGYGWHSTYLIYAIALPILILFLMVIPNDKKDLNKTNKTSRIKQSVNLPVILFSVMIFFVFMFFMVLSVQLSGLVVFKGLGTLAQASSVFGIFTLALMFSSLFYGKYFELLKHSVIIIGLVVMSIGFLLCVMANNLIVVIIGEIFIGIGLSMVIPYIYTMINVVAPKGSENLASSIMLVMTNIGVFLSPSIVGFMSGMFGKQTVTLNFLVSSIGLIIVAIFAIVLNKYLKISKLGELNE